MWIESEISRKDIALSQGYDKFWRNQNKTRSWKSTKHLQVFWDYKSNNDTLALHPPNVFIYLFGVDKNEWIPKFRAYLIHSFCSNVLKQNSLSLVKVHEVNVCEKQNVFVHLFVNIYAIPENSTKSLWKYLSCSQITHRIQISTDNPKHLHKELLFQ